MDPVSRSHRTAQVRCRELACPGRREESSDHREFSIQFFKDCTTRASWFETARERFSGAAAGLIVVPANAGTHTPRPLDFGWKELTPPANIKPCGYGPLRSQGRRLRVVAAELVPVHLSNSPPCAGTASRSRRTFRAGFALSFRPLVNRGRRECRMRVAPEAACAAKSTGVSNQGYTATAGIPCAMVLTVSFVLSPVTMLGCHRHQWNRFHQLSACVGAPGPHDFAVRTNTVRPGAPM